MAHRRSLSIMALRHFSSIFWLAGTLLALADSTPQGSSLQPLLTVEPRITYDRSCHCGEKGAARIVGGEVTGVNEWPWQAAILEGNQPFCGGSLINDRYILTAAHCIYDMSASQLTVRLAEHKLSTAGETDLVVRSVSRIIEHRDYQPGDEINDIALLKLSSPVEITDTVSPVCMPRAKSQYRGEKAIVTGWGDKSFQGLSSDRLREVTVRVMSNKKCRAGKYGSAIKTTMLCARAPGKDSCQGDSGGPLVFEDRRGYYDQIGIVSWGNGCADPDYPGVYTRVSKYLDWIQSNTEDAVFCRGSKF